MTAHERGARANWKRWRGLGAIDRRETLRAAVLVPLCGVSVRLFGLRQTRAWFTTPARSGASPSESAISRATKALERVRCHSPFPGTCLSRSLALQHLLLRSGITSELRLGVRRADRSIAGHAWIEVNGRPLNERRDVHREFVPLHK